MLDLPGIIEGASDGKGRGRQVISTARTSNLIMIVLDVLKPITHKLLIEKELEGFGIRLNKQPPKLTVRRKDRGGIAYVTHAPTTRLTKEEVRSGSGGAPAPRSVAAARRARRGSLRSGRVPFSPGQLFLDVSGAAPRVLL